MVVPRLERLLDYDCSSVEMRTQLSVIGAPLRCLFGDIFEQRALNRSFIERETLKHSF